MSSFDSELLLERLGHLGRWWAGQTEEDLDRVVDEPLQGGQRSNHDDPGAKTLPHACKAEFLGGTDEVASSGIVQLGHDGISRVGYDGTENTSDVTSCECDHQLFGLVALSAGFGHDKLVEGLHSALKAGKLHHGVRDLSAPQRHQALVKPVDSLLVQDSGESFSKCGAPPGLGLDPNLHGLQGAEGDVGEEFGRGTGSQVKGGSPQEGIFLSNHASVHIFEDFIKAEFTQALSGVTEECWSPAFS